MAESEPYVNMIEKLSSRKHASDGLDGLFNKVVFPRVGELK